MVVYSFKRLLLLLLLFIALLFIFVASDDKFDEGSIHYDKAMSIKLFSWDSLLKLDEQLVSMNVYYLKNSQHRFLGESWLKANCVKFVRLEDKLKLKKIVDELKFCENDKIVIPRKISYSSEELHVIFKLTSGKKAYIILKPFKNNRLKHWFALTYSSTVHVVKKPTMLIDLLGF